MFSKLSFLALSLPLVSALIFDTPTNVVSGQEHTFTWTLDGSEPPVYYILLGGPITYPLGPITYPGQTSITAAPAVPAGDGYFLKAAISPYGAYVFATSDPFPISAE